MNGSMHVEKALGGTSRFEPQIKPDRVLDDRRREAISAIGRLIHAGILPCRATRSNPVSVTMPWARRSARVIRVAKGQCRARCVQQVSRAVEIEIYSDRQRSAHTAS